MENNEDDMIFTVATPAGKAYADFTIADEPVKWSGDPLALRFIAAVFDVKGFTGYDGHSLSMNALDPEEFYNFCNSAENGMIIIPPFSYLEYLAEQERDDVVFDSLADAAKSVNTSPTESQKKAGNYAKGFVTLHGLKAVIENPKGSIRSGIDDASGKPWKSTMNAHYGYFSGSEGADGDHVDVFFGDDAESDNPRIFIVNQNYAESGDFDEHKVMFGYADIESAKKSYLGNYEKGWKGLGSIKETTLEKFKEWLFSEKTKITFDRLFIESEIRARGADLQKLVFDSSLDPLQKMEIAEEIETMLEKIAGDLDPLEQMEIAERVEELLAMLLEDDGEESGAVLSESSTFGMEKGEGKVTREPTNHLYPDYIETSASKRQKTNNEAANILRAFNGDELNKAELTEGQKRTLAGYSGNGGGLVGQDGKTGSPYEYYTPKPVVDASWELLKAAGFNGGKVLDPSAGVGIFGALAPKNAIVDAIELDGTSGGINKILNGDNGSVVISPFEAVASNTPDETHDAVITNIPFGDNAMRGQNKRFDDKYQDLSLEGYFIMRSLDKLKPGGSAVFISSSSFVSGASYERLRSLVALKAEFLGAYRLPNAQNTGEKTKKGNDKEASTFAGADVTSDVLVFRKHSRQVLDRIKDIQASSEGALLQESNVLWTTYISGKYFKEDGRPFILGEYTKGMSQYGEVERVVSGKPIAETASLMKMKPFRESRINLDLLLGADIDVDTPELNYQEGDAIYTDGQQFIMQNGEFVRGATVKGDSQLDANLVQAQSPLHALQGGITLDGIQSLQDGLANASRHKDVPAWMRELRTALNGVEGADKERLYDLYVTAMAARQAFDQHANERPFDFKTAYPELSAKMAAVAGIKFKVVGLPEGIRANLLTLKTLHNGKEFSALWLGTTEEMDADLPEEQSRKYDHIRYTEADKNGFVPLKRFTEVMGEIDLDADEWCVSPDGKGVMSASDFYSGNYADFLVKHGGDTSLDGVKARMGAGVTDEKAQWLREKLVRQMSAASGRVIRIDPTKMRFNLDSPFVTVDRKVEFLNRYIPDAANGFFVDIGDDGQPVIGYNESKAGLAGATSEEEFKERKRNINRFFQYITKGTLSTGSATKEKVASPAKEKLRVERLMNMIQENNQQFDAWAKANPTIQNAIEARLNDPNNQYFMEEDDGSPIDIPGINPKFKAHDYQNASVRRYARRMSGILGHDVGLGKTPQSLLVAQHIQSIGVKKKTMFVVPNATLSNWRKETKGVYADNSDCLFIGLDVTKDKDGNEKTSIKSDRYGRDLMAVLENRHKKIFISESAFGMIPFKDSTVADYLNYVGTVDKSFDAKEAKKKKDEIRIEGRLYLDLGDKNKSYPFFEDLGVDSLVLDEAHMYKNSKSVLEFKSAKQLSTPGASARGVNMQVASWWIRGRSKLGDGVLALTATPVTNSPLEMYSMLSLATGEEELNRRLGAIRGADEFMKAFCRVSETEAENLIGEFTMTRLFTGLTNTDMLSTVLHGTANIRTAKDVDLKIPEYDEIAKNVKLSEGTIDNLKSMKTTYALAREADKLMNAQSSSPGDTERLLEIMARLKPVMDLTGEGISILAHPFNLINKMSKMILDEDLAAKSTVYRFSDDQKALAEKAVEMFNALTLKDTRPEGRLTPVSGLNRTVLSKKTIKDSSSGDEIIMDVVRVDGYIDGNQISLDTEDFEHQEKFMAIATKLGLPLNVTVSAKVAAFLENFKQEASNPKSPQDPKAKPRTAKQIIFCDFLGMQNKLKLAIQQFAGIPSSKIKIVNGVSISDPSGMQGVQDGFNAEGEENAFSVVIANEKAEVGINLQKGCQAIHHLSIGWTPDSLQQRNGRGVRQGNYVERMNVYFYDADGTFDEYKRELVGMKADWIGQLLNRDNAGDIAVGGALSDREMEDLAAATGDAEAIRQIRERKVLREEAEKQKAAKAEIVGKLSAIQSHQKTIEKYPRAESYIGERIVAALRVYKSFLAAKSALAKEQGAEKPNPAKIATHENKIINAGKALAGMMNPIIDAVTFKTSGESGRKVVGFAEFFDDKTIAATIKDGVKWQQSYYDGSVSLKDESALKSLWEEEVSIAKATIEELTATAKTASSAVSMNDSRVDKVLKGEAVTFRGKILAAGDFVEHGKFTYVITRISRDGQHTLFALDTDKGEAITGNYSIVSAGDLITQEDEGYMSAVKRVFAMDNAFVAKKGGRRDVLYASEKEIRNKYKLYQHYNLHAAVLADAARGEEDNYYYLPSRQTASLTLKQPLYPRLITEKSDNPIMDKMMDEQRQHIEALDDDVLKIPKSLVAYVGGKSPEAHELNNVIIEKATQWGLKIPMDMLNYYGLVLAFTNTHKLSPSYSEFLNTLTSADTAITDTVKWLKNHYHLFGLSGMTDDEFMSKRIGNHELFGLLAGDIYHASKNLRARIDKLKSESPEAIAFVNELTAFIRVTGEELWGETKVAAQGMYGVMDKRAKVSAAITERIESHYGDENGNVEGISDSEIRKMIGAFLDSATVKPPVVAQEYMASADGKYAAVKLQNNMHLNKPEFNRFKAYFENKGYAPSFRGKWPSRTIPGAPVNSWIVRAEILESYFREYADTVTKYNIVRV